VGKADLRKRFSLSAVVFFSFVFFVGVRNFVLGVGAGSESSSSQVDGRLRFRDVELSMMDKLLAFWLFAVFA
jgi:hypothetical protein